MYGWRRKPRDGIVRPAVPAGPAAGRAGRAVRRTHLPLASATTAGISTAISRKGHEDNALAVDQPIGALLQDLKQRGLLDETLVVWSGEFGRTPFAQGSDGRDHNPFGFSLWLAGGGVKGGHDLRRRPTSSATRWSRTTGRDPRPARHDAAPAGIDHTRLTFRFSGRDMRLTDVHGGARLNASSASHGLTPVATHFRRFAAVRF
jgi:hypothetical protein